MRVECPTQCSAVGDGIVGNREIQGRSTPNDMDFSRKFDLKLISLVLGSGKVAVPWQSRRLEDSFRDSSHGVSTMTVLQTFNLTIRPCSPDDSADFIALENDPEVMRLLNGGCVDGHAQGNLEGTYLKPRGTELYVWTVLRSQARSFVGWICLWPEDDGTAELGYRLRRAEWGQGFASEAASALLDWGFSCANYDKVIASTMTVNQASRRVLEKVGMQHIRTVSADWAKGIPGGERGEVHYELTRLGWAVQPGIRAHNKKSPHS
jgi:RimJ/RimL family protein N-acetyltransferase